MASINTGKVVVGGLVAGVVANVIDFVTNTYVLAPDWTAFAQSHNLDAAAFTSGPVAATWVVVDFLYGLLIVWTYAAIRPRLGAGPGTALIAGFVLFATATIVIFGFTMMGLLTMSLFVKGTVGGIISTGAASLAGGAVYKEAGAAAGSAYARA